MAENGTETAGADAGASAAVDAVMAEVGDQQISTSDTTGQDGGVASDETTKPKADGTAEAGTDAPAGDADEGGEKPKLSKVEIEACKYHKLDPEKVDPSVARILAAERSVNDRLRTQVGRLRREIPAKGSGSDGDGGGMGSLDAAKLAELEVTGDDLNDAEALQAKMSKQFKFFTGRIAALEKSIQEAVAGRDEATSAKQDEAVNKWFAELDSDVFPDFGVGDLSEGDEDTPEFQARKAVVDDAYDLMEKAEARGRKLTFEQARERSLALNYPDEYENWQKAKTRAKVASVRRGQGVAPSGRKSSPPAKNAEESVMDELVELVKREGLQN